MRLISASADAAASGLSFSLSSCSLPFKTARVVRNAERRPISNPPKDRAFLSLSPPLSSCPATSALPRESEVDRLCRKKIFEKVRVYVERRAQKKEEHGRCVCLV